MIIKAILYRNYLKEPIQIIGVFQVDPAHDLGQKELALKILRRWNLSYLFSTRVALFVLSVSDSWRFGKPQDMMSEQVTRIGVSCVSRGVDNRHVWGSLVQVVRERPWDFEQFFYLNSSTSGMFILSSQSVSGLPQTFHWVSKITSIPQLTHHSPITINWSTNHNPRSHQPQQPLSFLRIPPMLQASIWWRLQTKMVCVFFDSILQTSKFSHTTLSLLFEGTPPCP